MLRVLCHFAKKNKFIRTPRKSKKTKSLEGSPSNGEEDSQPVEPAEAAALERVRASPKANASPKGKAKAKASPKAKTKKSSPKAKAKAKAKASTKKKNDESNNLSEEDDSSHASEAESKDDAIPEQHVTPQHKDDIFSMFQSRFSSLSSSSTTKTEKPIPKKAQPIPTDPKEAPPQRRTSIVTKLFSPSPTKGSPEKTARKRLTIKGVIREETTEGQPCKPAVVDNFEYGWDVEHKQAWRAKWDGKKFDRGNAEWVTPEFSIDQDEHDNPKAVFSTSTWTVPQITIKEMKMWTRVHFKIAPYKICPCISHSCRTLTL